MENYLKSSNETRVLEQKVYELDVQRYKLIIRGYKDKLKDANEIHLQEIEDIKTRAGEEIEDLEGRLKEIEDKHADELLKIEKANKKTVEELENDFKIREERLKSEIEDLKKEQERGKGSLKYKKECKTLKEEVKELKRLLKNTNNNQTGSLQLELDDLREKSKEIPHLHKEIQNLKDKLEASKLAPSDNLAIENKILQEKIQSLNDKNKDLEKELKELKGSIKKKEEGWFKTIVEQNDKLFKTLYKDSDILSSLVEGLNMLKRSVEGLRGEDTNTIIERFKKECKALIEETLTGKNDIKDKTISTLKAANELKSKIIKKQSEKISKKKPKDLSSDEELIKPEEENHSIVFGIENLTNKKPPAVKENNLIGKDQTCKKTKTNSFDEAVMTSVKNKKPVPVVKKPNLPKDAQKLNNASFFANITFTDSSPVIKKDGNKRK